MIKLILLFSFVLLSTINVGYGVGTGAFSFLLMSPSPRASALGESFSGVAEGPETVFYNPAGLGFERKTTLYLPALLPPFLEGIQYHHLTFLRPTRFGAWSIQSGILYAGGFTQTIADPSSSDGFKETGSFSAYDLKLSFSLGQKLRTDFGIGSSLHFIRESLHDTQANGFLADFGALYRNQESPFRFGLSFQNLGPKIKYNQDSYSSPALFRTGLMVERIQGSNLIYIPEHSFLTFELFRPFKGKNVLRAGMEIPFMKRKISFRSGYEYHPEKTDLGKKSFFLSGLAFGLGIARDKWKFDYAINSNGELGLIQRFSIEMGLR